MACPFFMPTSKLEDGGWLHPSRLPLGGGWIGHCSAPGHEGAEPTNEELRELCNMGYATACPRLPEDRTSDAVRFSIARDHGARLSLWISFHADPRIQKMAECYLQSYLLRRIQPATAGLKSDTTPLIGTP
jgi:hypothetical protein